MRDTPGVVALIVVAVVYAVGTWSWWRWRRRTIALLRRVVAEMAGEPPDPPPSDPSLRPRGRWVWIPEVRRDD